MAKEAQEYIIVRGTTLERGHFLIPTYLVAEPQHELNRAHYTIQGKTNLTDDVGWTRPTKSGSGYFLLRTIAPNSSSSFQFSPHVQYTMPVTPGVRSARSAHSTLRFSTFSS